MGSPSARYRRGTVLGSYRLDDVLGEGGMGIVYAATHMRLDRRVAIKVLRPELAGDPRAIGRFFGEARAVNKIAHPNVVEVTDFVERPGEDNYYVMELLEGASLGELVAIGGMLTLPRAVGIMTQLASALAAVHRAGIVHRDLKPSNVILVARNGQSDFVKLVDFGVAKLAGELDLAGGELVAGTPRYMAPEHLVGQPVDHRADIYSFGVTLYELVTGRPPFEGSSAADIVHNLHTTRPIPPRAIPGLPDPIPPALDVLILGCLELDPAARPTEMEEVGARLERISLTEGWVFYERSATGVRPLTTPLPGPAPLVPSLAPAPPPEPAAAPAPRRGALLWGLAAVALIAAASAVVYVAYVADRRGAAPAAAAAAQAGSASVAAKVSAELAIADRRIAEGRLLAENGDDALAHLVAARTLDPGNADVRARLSAIAHTFHQLADQAIAAGSLAEAATDLQAVVTAEPDDAAAAAQMHQVEDEILNHQRAGRR